MYYKVLKDNKVIDVLDCLIYLKWQPKRKTMVLTDIYQAQAILGSDGNTIWHERTLYEVPVDEPKFDTVDLVEIDQYEYKQLKMLNMRDPQSIIDEYTLQLIEGGIL